MEWPSDEIDSSSGLFELVQAALGGNLADVKRYVTDVNVDESCEIYGHSATALGVASRSGHLEVVRFLLDYGADVSITSDDSTPLHLACDEGHLDVVKILLAHGAGLEQTDWYRRTALHRACDSGHNEVVLTLLAHGADVGTKDDEDWTPLHISRSGRVARTLLEYGAEVNARDALGFTPLARMSLCDSVDRVSTLLDYGAGAGIICGLLHTKYDQRCSKTVLMCCYNLCHDEIFREWLPCYEEYFIKTNAAGISNKFEKPENPPMVGVDWSQSERDSFKDKCLAELSRMKMDIVGGTSASYFNLLTRNIAVLRGQNILDNVPWEECRRNYPIYGDMIRCSYQSLRRFFLKDQAILFFSLTPCSLLSECAEMVLDYLSEKELETLFRVVSQACMENVSHEVESHNYNTTSDI